MAVIAAMDIAALRGWASLQVYTIGAPRPGNRAFSKVYNSKVPDTWHIINEKASSRCFPLCIATASQCLATHEI